MTLPKTAIERRKPIRVAFDINNVRRVKTAEGIECRLVEGYSYVNAWVGDGYNLTRQAMVAATTDYNRWGAVREMHQPSAVGRASGSVKILNEQDAEEDVTLGVIWDDKGALCRSLVVDPTAMVKLDTGVYKAYSVGVAPVVMQGVDVIRCTWIENSLCDRPADPDALLTLIRSDTADMNAEVEVVQLVVKRSFADSIPLLSSWAKDAVVADACYELMDCLWEAVRANDRAGDVDAAVADIDEFAQYLKDFFTAGPGMERCEQLVALARTRLSPESAETLSRFAVVSSDLAAATGRAATAEAELTRLQGELATRNARITELEAMPDPTQNLPYRGAERSLLPHVETDVNPDVAKYRGELAEAVKRSKEEGVSQVERTQLATTISSLRQRLQALGEVA